MWIFVSRFFDPPKEPNELFNMYVQIVIRRAHQHKHKEKSSADVPTKSSSSGHPSNSTHNYPSSKHKNAPSGGRQFHSKTSKSDGHLEAVK